MLTQAQALSILGRYVPAEQAEPLLSENTITRTVGGVALSLYDPYAAALAYLMHPNTVKSRTEGSVSETYIDPTTVAAYLEGQSALLRESWPVADPAGAALEWDLSLDVRGWNQ